VKSYDSGSSESGISSAWEYFLAYDWAFSRAFLNSAELSPNFALALTSVLASVFVSA